MKITSSDFDYVRKLVLQKSALVLGPGKEYLVESRLNMLASREGFSSLHHLIQGLHLDRSGLLTGKVVEAMMTHETTFFRDVRPFETLRKVVVPALMVRRASERSLNIWCAGCSTGQETYSIAMLLLEHFPALAGWTVYLMGSDISKRAIDRARAGRYTQLEINRGLAANLLVKFFQKAKGDWQVNGNLRRMAIFQEINLAGPWPRLPRMDVIFLRNVLIYFDAETRRNLLGRARRLLNPDGYLFLGGSETITGANNGFERVPDEPSTIFRPTELCDNKFSRRVPDLGKAKLMTD
ncbi:MAG TPA: protein-glutamate O-methyltransferase CheR [Candidatus Acidoferrales bacterium]